MADERFQYEVFIRYDEIDQVYLRETTYNSKNKPVEKYWITALMIYIVLCCKNGEENAINILFYSKKCRIKIINEIITRAKFLGNDFTNETGQDIYNSFLASNKKKKHKNS